MRFTSIDIQNYRQYQNLHIRFPKKTDYDLHVIVADNGVGKTNILNAITWCLYGEEPHLGNASKSLPKVSLKAKNETKEKENPNVIISVRISAEDNGTPIIFFRKLTVNTETDFEYKQEFSVIINTSGDSKILEGEDATAYVERYMPKKIRQYFYFDGEQLDSYFISDESSKIKGTIHTISQVDIVTKMRERLEKIIAAKRSEAGKKSPDIKALNDELNRREAEIKDLQTQIEQLESQISKSEAVIKTNSEKLSGQEDLPELENKYEKLQRRKEDLETLLHNEEKRIFSFVRDMKISMSMYKNARIALSIIAEKESQNALPPNIDKNLLKKLLSSPEGHCDICDQQLSAHAIEHIENLLEKIQVSSETSHLLLSIRNELERAVTDVHCFPQKKKEHFTSLKAVSEELKQCGQELQDVDDKITAFGDENDKKQISHWHNERKEHTELLKINSDKKAVTEFQLKQAQESEQKIRDNLQKALETANQCKHINELIKYATEAKSIVESIECEMMTEVRDKMQKQTMEYFDDLIWKKGIYNRIVLDDKYQLDLFHRDGYSCVGSCSAAERSLLALSFTLALHKVSGFDSLLFIDTPVARVTSQNRVNFANVLKCVSKEDKQLIMAFTPDEYSENIRSIFSPIASSSAHLKMNSENEITAIDKGV